MKITNNYINFRAHIKNSNELQTGFNFAEHEMYSEAQNCNYANYLANSINLFVNDGTNDIYEIKKDKEEENKYLLNKNGKNVYARDSEIAGKSVIFLLSDYAQFIYSKSIVSPWPEEDKHDSDSFFVNMQKKLNCAKNKLED